MKGIGDFRNTVDDISRIFWKKKEKESLAKQTAD